MACGGLAAGVADSNPRRPLGVVVANHIKELDKTIKRLVRYRRKVSNLIADMPMLLAHDLVLLHLHDVDLTIGIKSVELAKAQMNACRAETVRP